MRGNSKKQQMAGGAERMIIFIYIVYAYTEERNYPVTEFSKYKDSIGLSSVGPASIPSGLELVDCVLLCNYFLIGLGHTVSQWSFPVLYPGVTLSTCSATL